MDVATLTSSDAAAMDRLILVLLLMTVVMLVMMLVIHSLLLRKEGSINDDDARELKDMVREFRRRDDQSAVSKELLVATQTQRDTHLRLSGDGEEERVEVSSSSSAASDQQLMDNASAAKKKDAATAAKKKRNKRNKAAAKHKAGTKRMSWRSGGIISLIMIMAAAFGSITTFIPLSLIHQSDGSSGGKAPPPTLPPSASTSLRRRDLQSSNNNMASSTSPASRSPLAEVVQAPVFSPRADVSVINRRMNSVDDESAPTTCFDTPNWKDTDGLGCDWYEQNEERGCPIYGSFFDGGMGVANDNCCYCGGGSHSLPPTTSPTKSSSPTKSATPSSSPTTSSSPTISANPTELCFDTPNWKDSGGDGCDWYEANDEPGCPNYGSLFEGNMGVANDNCCYCGGGSHSLPPTTSPKPSSSPTKSSSPTVSASPTESCLDTPNWKDIFGSGCDYYEAYYETRCPEALIVAGEMGPATEHCCSCGGGSLSCEDFRSKCQDYINVLGVEDGDGGVAPLCDKAESFCCKAGHHVEISTDWGWHITVGLYNECKCNFWSRLCEDTRGGEACDYAAEYCCGDYMYNDIEFIYLDSPTCYCDFFNYAQNEFGHALKSKALIKNEEFSNPCRQFDNMLSAYSSEEFRELEKKSLAAIYNGTDGQNWIKNSGWMNNETDYCQWYGITCGIDGFVTSIDLRDNNLAGQFPVYTRNEIALEFWQFSKFDLATLVKLKTLYLADNKLTGTIDYRLLYNLNALTHFDVSGNQLSGDMVALVAPSLTYADFSHNNFTSIRRFEKYKGSFHTLRYCDASNNAIQEDATDVLENIPPNVVQVIASNNQIYGILPESLNNLQKLRQFNMASNALSGKLPGFTESFATLQELDVFNQTNGLSGSIPENIWRSLSLKKLNLAGNRLTGTVPSLVGNLVVLEVFDLSNNRLDSSIPAELGMLEGSLKRLNLSNNTFSGIIPYQIGQLQGASVFLKNNHFYNSSTTAPLSLCLEREVKEFDLVNDATLCPPERNGLVDFYNSTKSAEWTDRSNWTDEYGYCDWKGVTCDNNTKHVTKLQLSNNGLSGRLSKRIGELEFIEVLDLSDNDIKGSIPAEIGKLKNLTYLRLSYNAFTGTAPKELGELTKLQLLQLQSNRITEMPNIPRLNDNIYNESTFVTDCGAPSAFDEPLECENCTVCCNANDDCHPQEETQVAKWGLKGYGTFAALVFGCFIVFCCIVALLLYEYDRRKNHGITLTMAMETRIKEDDEYALSKIGKNSVYSYFVTDKVFGWLAAFATVGTQIGILVVFILASEPKLQDDKSDIKYTWKCPRDTYVCKDKSDLEKLIWVIFCLLMVAFLAKDMISGSKLIYHSAKVRHSLGSRVRYFFGGMCLCWITLFAIYVSIVYNMAIATRNTELILNSVVVLFVMDMDEWIFATLEAANEKWTAHAADGSEGTHSDIEARNESIKAEMKEEMARQIASQQEEMERKIVEVKEEMNKEIELQKARIVTQQEELRMLRELVEKIQQSQAAAAAAITTITASDSESVSEYEDDTNARQMEQSDEITMPCDGEQNIQEPQAAATTPDSHRERESDTEEDLQE